MGSLQIFDFWHTRIMPHRLEVPRISQVLEIKCKSSNGLLHTAYHVIHCVVCAALQSDPDSAEEPIKLVVGVPHQQEEKHQAVQIRPPHDRQERHRETNAAVVIGILWCAIRIDLEFLRNHSLPHNPVM